MKQSAQTHGYKYIAPGISKYHQQYRVTWIDENKQQQVTYLPTLEDARAHLNNVNPCIGINRHKRSNAKAQDLPVGLCDSVARKVLKSGNLYISNMIAATVKPTPSSKLLHKRVTYGDNRTREEAIAIAKQWREDKLRTQAE